MILSIDENWKYKLFEYIIMVNIGSITEVAILFHNCMLYSIFDPQVYSFNGCSLKKISSVRKLTATPWQMMSVLQELTCILLTRESIYLVSLSTNPLVQYGFTIALFPRIPIWWDRVRGNHAIWIPGKVSQTEAEFSMQSNSAHWASILPLCTHCAT